MCHFAVFLAVIFAISTAENVSVKQCDPERMIVENEVIRPCVYYDKRNIKRVAVGYNMQSPAAKTDFQTIGAAFVKFNNGPVTPVSEKCNCSDVPCLDERQIDELLERSLKVATADAARVIKTFPNLCCPVRKQMVYLAFVLGSTEFEQLASFAQMIDAQNWEAAAKYLTATTWCASQDSDRCTESLRTIRKGCPSFSPSPRPSFQQRYCCPTLFGSCCDGTWCCPWWTNAVCCQDFKCCPRQNPVCCPRSDACCFREHPVCCTAISEGFDFCCPAHFPVCLVGQRCGAALVKDGVRETVLGVVSKSKKSKL